MRRRRRGQLAFWLVLAVLLLVNYLVGVLAPHESDPAVSSTAHAAVSAFAHPAVSAGADAAVSAGAHRVDFAAPGELVSLDHLEAAL
jgi:hypothetical protein